VAGRALIILLSHHEPGGTVRYSEVIQVQQAYDVSAGRTAEVLQEMGVLDDDRRPSFEDWLGCKLDGLAPGIRADAEAWLRTLHDGGPRSRPRDIATAWNHMYCLRPTLLAWSSQYGHLREVARDDVLTVLGELHGSRRSNVLVAMRSLFASCKRRKTIFRSPVQGIRVGQRPYGVIQPLSQDEVDLAAEAANTPAARLVLVLAAMHAARVKAIRGIRIEDVDLGNRRIVIGGRARPLDDLTSQVLLEWLAHRGTRRPSTANPHLLVNQQSANGTGPISTSYFAKTALRGKTAWKSFASTGSSRRPSHAAPTRCAWPRCSASTPRPRSATRKMPASCSSQRPKSRIPPTPARPRTVDTRPEGEATMPGSEGLAGVAEALAVGRSIAAGGHEPS
jgi:integrase